jgi:hypothetical protein
MNLRPVLCLVCQQIQESLVQPDLVLGGASRVLSFEQDQGLNLRRKWFAVVHAPQELAQNLNHHY